MSSIDRLGALAGSALVHALLVLVWRLAVPELVAGLPSLPCICIESGLQRPLIGILDPGVSLEPFEGDGRAGLDERCRPGLRRYYAAEPAFPLFQGRTLVARSAAAATDPVVCARILAAGRIGAAYLLRRSGDPEVDDAVLVALRGLRFRPALDEGRPRSVWHRIVIPLG